MEKVINFVETKQKTKSHDNSKLTKQKDHTFNFKIFH